MSRKPASKSFPPPADRDAAARLVESYAALGRQQARFARESAGRALLEAIGGNAPFLADLALRAPEIPIAVLREGADRVVGEIIQGIEDFAPDIAQDRLAAGLRQARGQAALAIALADLGGFWPLDRVTGALSTLAEAATDAVLRHLLRVLHDRGVIHLADPDHPCRDCSFVALGMGKLGAGELNYSSDIDLVLIFDPSSPVYRDDAQTAMARLARDLTRLLSEQDGNGRVFRLDLRLRPDPAATPPVISLAAALAYYESQGRTWERAAFIKARPVAGDIDFGASFLDQIRPFVWRRHLDFAAVGEIHEMKRRIDAGEAHGNRGLPGRNVKLGRGGIREIEFMAQTLELVWGGHEPALRIPATLKALRALALAGHLDAPTARMLSRAYQRLRQIEHRLQMVADRQTHTLPDTEAGLDAFATFMGEADPARFRGDLAAMMEEVHAAFAGFFEANGAAAEEAERPTPQRPRLDPGFDGKVPAAFHDHVAGLGFADPSHLATRIRIWRSGAPPALRSARARDLLDEILPDLLASLAREPDPDLAFRRFDQLLGRQQAGVQLFSLFQRNPALLDRLSTVLGAAQPLAEHLAGHPGALEALLDPAARFADPQPILRRQLRDARDLEDTLAILRNFVRREEFHISVARLEMRLDADAAGRHRTALAEAALGALLPACLAEMTARHGRLRGGRVAIVALGRAGAGEMLAGSDLDLMLIYDHPPDAAAKRLAASPYFIRLAHLLVAALTAPGAEGPIYPVDMRLRPSGNKGPVAVSLAAFRHYHEKDAWTWERLALTRARVLAATRGFRPVVETAIRDALCRRVASRTIRADTVAMRARLARDAPARGSMGGAFDLKHRDGGMMELGFIAESQQLIHGPRALSLFRTGTRAALEALAGSGHLGRRETASLIAADRLYRSVQGMMRITGLTDPAAGAAPASLDALLAAADQALSVSPKMGWPAPVDFPGLVATLAAAAEAVRTAFRRHVGDPAGAAGGETGGTRKRDQQQGVRDER